MTILMKTAMMTLVIPMTIMFLTMMMMKKMHLNQEKSSMYECGFDPYKKARQPFSLHFFLITLIFLIFDAEIALILPLVPSMNFHPSYWSVITLTFYIILLMGTYHEWKQGILNWK